MYEMRQVVVDLTLQLAETVKTVLGFGHSEKRKTRSSFCPRRKSS